MQRYLHDETVQACPPSAGYRFRKFARRNKRALASAAILGVMLLATVGAVAGSMGWVMRDRAARQLVVNDIAALALADADEKQLKEVVGRFLGGPPEGARAAVYKGASPVHQISSEIPPILLIYGGADSQVPVQTADEFVVALGRAGLKAVSFYRLAYVDHCPHSLVRIPVPQTVVNEFFLRTLMHPETARQINRRVR